MVVTPCETFSPFVMIYLCAFTFIKVIQKCFACFEAGLLPSGGVGTNSPIASSEVKLNGQTSQLCTWNGRRRSIIISFALHLGGEVFQCDTLWCVSVCMYGSCGISR